MTLLPYGGTPTDPSPSSSPVYPTTPTGSSPPRPTDPPSQPPPPPPPEYALWDHETWWTMFGTRLTHSHHFTREVSSANYWGDSIFDALGTLIGFRGNRWSKSSEDITVLAEGLVSANVSSGFLGDTDGCTIVTADSSFGWASSSISRGINNGTVSMSANGLVSATASFSRNGGSGGMTAGAHAWLWATATLHNGDRGSSGVDTPMTAVADAYLSAASSLTRGDGRGSMSGTAGALVRASNSMQRGTGEGGMSQHAASVVTASNSMGRDGHGGGSWSGGYASGWGFGSGYGRNVEWATTFGGGLADPGGDGDMVQVAKSCIAAWNSMARGNGLGNMISTLENFMIGANFQGRGNGDGAMVAQGTWTLIASSNSQYRANGDGDMKAVASSIGRAYNHQARGDGMQDMVAEATGLIWAQNGQRRGGLDDTTGDMVTWAGSLVTSANVMERVNGSGRMEAWAGSLVASVNWLGRGNGDGDMDAWAGSLMGANNNVHRADGDGAMTAWAGAAGWAGNFLSSGQGDNEVRADAFAIGAAVNSVSRGDPAVGRHFSGYTGFTGNYSYDWAGAGWTRGGGGWRVGNGWPVFDGQYSYGPLRGGSGGTSSGDTTTTAIGLAAASNYIGMWDVDGATQAVALSLGVGSNVVWRGANAQSNTAVAVGGAVGSNVVIAGDGPADSTLVAVSVGGASNVLNQGDGGGRIVEVAVGGFVANNVGVTGDGSGDADLWAVSVGAPGGQVLGYAGNWLFRGDRARYSGLVAISAFGLATNVMSEGDRGGTAVLVAGAAGAAAGNLLIRGDEGGTNVMVAGALLAAGNIAWLGDDVDTAVQLAGSLQGGAANFMVRGDGGGSNWMAAASRLVGSNVGWFGNGSGDTHMLAAGILGGGVNALWRGDATTRIVALAGGQSIGANLVRTGDGHQTIVAGALGGHASGNLVVKGKGGADIVGAAVAPLGGAGNAVWAQEGSNRILGVAYGIRGAGNLIVSGINWDPDSGLTVGSGENDVLALAVSQTGVVAGNVVVAGDGRMTLLGGAVSHRFAFNEIGAGDGDGTAVGVAVGLGNSSIAGNALSLGDGDQTLVGIASGHIGAANIMLGSDLDGAADGDKVAIAVAWARNPTASHAYAYNVVGTGGGDDKIIAAAITNHLRHPLGRAESALAFLRAGNLVVSDVRGGGDDVVLAVGGWNAIYGGGGADTLVGLAPKGVNLILGGAFNPVGGDGGLEPPWVAAIGLLGSGGFEDPTGTGASLALGVGWLHWLATNGASLYSLDFLDPLYATGDAAENNILAYGDHNLVLGANGGDTMVSIANQSSIMGGLDGINLMIGVKGPRLAQESPAKAPDKWKATDIAAWLFNKFPAIVTLDGNMMVGGKDADTMIGANLYRLTAAERAAGMYVSANMNVMHGDLGDNTMVGVGQINAMSAGRYKETVFFNLAGAGQWRPWWSTVDNVFTPLYNFEGAGDNTMVGIATVDNKMWAGDGDNIVIGIALGESWESGPSWPPLPAPTGKTITGKNRIRLGEGDNTVLGIAVDGKIEARGGNNRALGIASKSNDVIANGDGDNFFVGIAFGRGMHRSPNAPYPEFMGVNRIGVQNGNNRALGLGDYNFMLAVKDITEDYYRVTNWMWFPTVTLGEASFKVNLGLFFTQGLHGNTGDDTFVGYGRNVNVAFLGDGDNIGALVSQRFNAGISGSGDDWLLALGPVNLLWSGTGNDVVAALGAYNVIIAADSNLGFNLFNLFGLNSEIDIAAGQSPITGEFLDSTALPGFIAGWVNGISGPGNGTKDIAAIGAVNVIASAGAQNNIAAAGGINAVVALSGRSTIATVGTSFIGTGNGDDAVVVSNSTFGYINAGNGNNSLFVSGTDNVIRSGSGDDLIVTTGFNDVDSGAGNDTVLLRASPVGGAQGASAPLRGGAGNDRLIAGGLGGLNGLGASVLAAVNGRLAAARAAAHGIDTGGPTLQDTLARFDLGSVTARASDMLGSAIASAGSAESGIRSAADGARAGLAGGVAGNLSSAGNPLAQGFGQAAQRIGALPTSQQSPLSTAAGAAPGLDTAGLQQQATAGIDGLQGEIASMESMLSGRFSSGNAAIAAGMAGIGRAVSGMESRADGLTAPVVGDLDFTGTLSQIGGAVDEVRSAAADNGGYRQESTNPNDYLGQFGNGGSGGGYRYPGSSPGYSIPGYSTGQQPSYPSHDGSAGALPGFEGIPAWASAPGFPISWPELGEFGYVPGSEYASYPQAGQYPGQAGYPGAPGAYDPSAYGQTPPSNPRFGSVEDASSRLQAGSDDLGSVLDPARSRYSDATNRAAQNPEATQQLAAGQQALAATQSSGQTGIDAAAWTVSGTLQEAGSAASDDIAAGMAQLDDAPRVSDEVSRALGADGAGVALREFDAMVAEMQGVLGGASTLSGGQQVRDGLLAGLDQAGAMVGASGPVAGTVLDGGTGADILVGDGGADTLFGGADDDLLIGRGGNDAIHGGSGSDTYLYARGDGWDTLHASREPTGSLSSSPTYTYPGQPGGTTMQSSLDVLVLDGGISRRDVWFWLDGNDLRVGAGTWNGNTLSVSGGVAVSGWNSTTPTYPGYPVTGGSTTTAGNREALDRIVSSDGYALDASRIDRLVSAMAAFGAPGSGSITLTQQQRDSVNAVIAQSWQSAA